MTLKGSGGVTFGLQCIAIRIAIQTIKAIFLFIPLFRDVANDPKSIGHKRPKWNEQYRQKDINPTESVWT
jgi:hypothetical protein